MKQKKQKRWSVYELRHPQTAETRYVGKTADTPWRLGEHIKARGRTYSANWVRSLVRCDLVPTLAVIVVVETDAEAKRIEKAWIAVHKARGTRLTNLTDGGDGISGYRHRPETLKAMSDASTVLMTPEARVNLSVKMKAARQQKHWVGHTRPHSAAAKQKMRAAKLGKPLTPEHRAKIGAAQRGRPMLPHVLASLRASRLGSHHSAETKAVISRKIAALMTPARREQIGRWTRDGMARAQA